MAHSHRLKPALVFLGVLILLISWLLPRTLTDDPIESGNLPPVSSGPPPSSQPKESAACDSIREWLIHTGQDPIQDCAEFEQE
jgi:hypothetical protein